MAAKATQCIVGLMMALLVGCASGGALTPGTAEMPRTVTVAALDPFTFAPARIPGVTGLGRAILDWMSGPEADRRPTGASDAAEERD